MNDLTATTAGGGGGALVTVEGVQMRVRIEGRNVTFPPVRSLF